MVQRIALFVASLAAALVVAAGLALAGFGPAHSAPAAIVPVDPAAATTSVPPDPVVQVDTVYLATPAAPQDVTVTKVVTPAHHGDDDGGAEND